MNKVSQTIKPPPAWKAGRQGKTRGVPCPKCDSNKTGVVDSRPTQDGIRRRRCCDGCHLRFTTLEAVTNDTGERRQVSDIVLLISNMDVADRRMLRDLAHRLGEIAT